MSGGHDPAGARPVPRFAELDRHLRPGRRLGPREADLHRAHRRILIDFGKGLVDRHPRASSRKRSCGRWRRLAEGTRGYDLLKAVLGRGPDHRRAGAAQRRHPDRRLHEADRPGGDLEQPQARERGGRAWAWFQGALAGADGLRAADPRAVRGRAAVARDRRHRAAAACLRQGGVGVFGSFIGRFFSWAGQQVLERCCEIIFEVVAPGVMPYLRKRARRRFGTIIAEPHRLRRQPGARRASRASRQFATQLPDPPARRR